MHDHDTVVHTVSVNEITHVIKPNIINANWTPLHSKDHPLNKTQTDRNPSLSSLIMPSDLQVHRHVPINYAKVSQTTKLALQELLQEFDSVISKNSNDIGWTDLKEMHIATRQDAKPIAAHPYPLVLKHHDFLKQEIQNLLDAGIICKSMSQWASLIVVFKKHTTEGSPQQF